MTTLLLVVGGVVAWVLLALLFLRIDSRLTPEDYKEPLNTNDLVFWFFLWWVSIIYYSVKYPAKGFKALAQLSVRPPKRERMKIKYAKSLEWQAKIEQEYGLGVKDDIQEELDAMEVQR